MKIECPYLSQFPSLRHAFFGALSDPLQNNWAIESMAGRSVPLITLKQVHGNKVIPVNEVTKELREGDGLVTSVPGIALGISTADCGPVLFYDPIAQVIGACHAGWRGAKAGILQETLRAMEKLGAKCSRIYASLGPTIRQENYEVGPEFPDLINFSYEEYFYPSKKLGHHYFNLPHYICQQLLNEELAQVYDLGYNTFTGNFASLRRNLSQGKEKLTQSNLSAIAIV